MYILILKGRYIKMKINTRKTADKIENTYEVYEMTTNLGLIVALSPIGASIQKIAIQTELGEELFWWPSRCRVKIQFSAFQPDNLDGFPGNRTYQAIYTLDDTNWLTVEYAAWTDTPTYINLSNHTYWNLSGDFSRSGLEQELTICSNNMCLLNTEFLPKDIIPVAGTAFDFRSPRHPDAAIRASRDELSCSQIHIGKGYNHAYLLNRPNPFRTLHTSHSAAKKSLCSTWHQFWPDPKAHDRRPCPRTIYRWVSAGTFIVVQQPVFPPLLRHCPGGPGPAWCHAPPAQCLPPHHPITAFSPDNTFSCYLVICLFNLCLSILLSSHDGMAGKQFKCTFLSVL